LLPALFAILLQLIAEETQAEPVQL
jgi:uncharacterized membrane protein